MALARLATLTGASAPQPEDTVGSSILAAIHAGALDVSTRPEGSGGQHLTWASWTEGTPDHWVTRLVLIRQTADGAAITWGTQRPDGYGAVPRSTPWQWRGHPVLIPQYQFGAASTRMELCATGFGGQGGRLGRVDGTLIALERQRTDETSRAFHDATLRGPQRRYGWREAAARLVMMNLARAAGLPP